MCVLMAGELRLEAAGGRAAEDAGALQGAAQQVRDYEQEATRGEGVSSRNQQTFISFMCFTTRQASVKHRAP